MKSKPVAAALLIAPMPAWAHGAALEFMITQLFLYVLLLLLSPVVNKKGKKLWGFVITLIGYPALFFSVPALTYGISGSSSTGDEIWAIAMYIIAAAFVVVPLYMRSRGRT